MLARDLQAETRYAKVSDHLRRLILSGELQPGDRLPSFPEMRAQGVSQNTMERVHSILAKEGLIERVPRRGVFVAARRVPRSALLGVVTTFLVNESSSYYTRLLKGISDEAYARDAEIMLLRGDSYTRWADMDGLILIGLRDYGPLRLPKPMPAVSLMQRIDGVAAVMGDERQGIFDAMEHLHGLGHRRIAFLGTISSERLPWPRYDAYIEALRRAGTEPDPRWARDLRFTGLPGFADAGQLTMREWLAQGFAELGCTALLVQNDETAIGVIEACREAGLDVPGSLSIVGFDDIEIGKYVTPRLTTIAVPLEQGGQSAVAMLLGRDAPLNAATQSQVATVLPLRLEARESTAAPRF